MLLNYIAIGKDDTEYFMSYGNKKYKDFKNLFLLDKNELAFTQVCER